MEWPEVPILDAVREAVMTACKTGGPFDIGLKVCDVGDWDVPAPDVLADFLPAIIIVSGNITQQLNDIGRGALYFEGDLELNLLRLLGPTERKNYAIKQDAAKIKNFLTPLKLRGLAGWTPDMSATTKFVPAFSYVSASLTDEGFLCEEPHFDIEHERITLHFGGDLYFRQ